MSLSLFKSQKLQDRMELVAVEPSGNLSQFEKIFCLNYAQGARATAAYKQALPEKERDDLTERLLFKKVNALLAKEEVKDYLESLTSSMEKHGVISALEIQLYLTDAILTPPSEIDENSPLCKKKIVREMIHKDGTIERTTTYEKVDPLKSVDIMAKIKGMYAPIKLDMRHTGGIMVIPMATDLDSWEAAAMQSQAELMSNAIDV
jgi:hypothetical protein